MRFVSHSENQTKNIAKKIARKLKGGEVLALVGELGAGKTIFTKGLASGLGIKQNIHSPTFLLLKTYKLPGKKPKAISHKLYALCHIDAYRIENPAELIESGLEEWIGRPNTVCVIEWADKIFKKMPRGIIQIKFKLGKKKNERRIYISNLPDDLRR